MRSGKNGSEPEPNILLTTKTNSRAWRITQTLVIVGAVFALQDNDHGHPEIKEQLNGIQDSIDQKFPENGVTASEFEIYKVTIEDSLKNAVRNLQSRPVEQLPAHADP